MSGGREAGSGVRSSVVAVWVVVAKPADSSPSSLAGGREEREERVGKVLGV